MDVLNKLQAPFDETQIKWKVQAEKGDWSTFVAYVDSRIVASKLDNATGGAWQDEYKEINGLLICRIGIYFHELKEWVWREDTGTESNIDKEKGHVSDAFKRASVKWGVGRHLYDMPIIKIKNSNGKAVYDGKRVYDATDVCKKLLSANKGKAQIWHDDTKLKKPTPPKMTRKQGMELISSKITVVIDEQLKNEIAYELTDNKHLEQKENIIAKLNAGANPADVLTYLIEKK